jgi:hypothetical protein
MGISFRHFRTGPNTRPIAINPHKVLYVKPGSPGRSVIYFSPEEAVTVEGELSEVVRSLETND